MLRAALTGMRTSHAPSRGRRERNQIGVDPLDRITDMRGDLRRNDLEFFHLDLNDRITAARAHNGARHAEQAAIVLANDRAHRRLVAAAASAFVSSMSASPLVTVAD